jgi:enoyl-CoA hydratase/carnithine racemase
MDEWNLESTEGAWLLTMANAENRIDRSMLDAWASVLDRVEGDASRRPLVVTGTGKFWSTGLDLNDVERFSTTQRVEFMERFDELLGRILTAPFVMVAALNGHTVAGGALLALAHDYRIMRGDQGYFSLPSVDIGIPFSPGMSALISAKVPQPAANDLVVSCRRIGGLEAQALGVVSGTASSSSVVPDALDLAASLGNKDPETLRTVKQRLYADTAAKLMNPS